MNEQNFKIQSYTKYALSKWYKISTTMLGKWVKRAKVFEDYEEYRRVKRLMPEQVKKIVEKIGEP